jgi:CRISPR/Cas system-associated exonuclease Cas4 (RecB family)
VHQALDVFANVLAREGHPAPGSAEFRAIRRLFPIRETVRRLRAAELLKVRANPRAEISVIAPAVSVDRCIESFKQMIQVAYLSNETRGARQRPRTPALSEDRSYSGSPDDWVPVPALLPEVPITLASPAVTGRIDLVMTRPRDGDILTEFKTGLPREEHEAQTRFYAALWWGKTRREIGERRLVYAAGSIERLPALASAELNAELTTLGTRVTNAYHDLWHSPPPARPAAKHCQRCPVRQLCDTYWTSGETVDTRWQLTDVREVETLVDGRWADLELSLADVEVLGDGFVVPLPIPDQSRHGKDHPTRLTCHIPSRFHNAAWQTSPFVRLLNVGIRRKGSVLRIVWSRHSELFWG